MKEKLKELFEELKLSGLEIDDKRSVASLKLSSRIDFASSDEEEIPLSLNEDEQYLWAPFRALSAVIIDEKFIDFGAEGVLKKSVKLLKGQTVYTNHSRDVNDWIGVVAKTWWDEAGPMPPGVNATLKIKKKWNERVVDGIKEGAIHSASVDVYFEYAKSHPDLDDFWFLMGEEVDGEIVRIIATKIISYGEISLVWQGADIWARRIGLSSGGRDSGSVPGREEKSNEGGNDMKLSRSIAMLLGLSLVEYGFGSSQQEVELDGVMQIRFFSDVANAFEKMKAEKESNRRILELLFGKDFDEADSKSLVEDLMRRASMGDEYLSDIREDALKFAKLSENTEKLNEALEKAIMGADLEDAKRFRDEYRKKADEKYPATCPACGETLTRASASKKDTGEETEEQVNASDYEF